MVDLDRDLDLGMAGAMNGTKDEHRAGDRGVRQSLRCAVNDRAPDPLARVGRRAGVDGLALAIVVLTPRLSVGTASPESIYEARNRPDWLPVPLAGIDAALA